MWQEIHDKEHWNNLVVRIEHAPFLQSWQWGQFQESLGREVRRLSWEEEIAAQAIRMPLSLGKSYWYIPRGPIVIPAQAGIHFIQNESFKELEQNFAEIGLFLRVDPYSHPLPYQVRDRLYPPSGRGGLSGFPSSARRGRSGAHVISSVQAQCVRILDIRKSADDLLAAMHPKTRYNINLAQKKGVVVGPGNIDDFLRLNRATRKRDKFRPHPDYYYQRMLDSVIPRLPAGGSGQAPAGMTKGNDFLRVWQASYQNTILAGAIIIYFNDTAAYVHGASSDQYREVMSPHLLHWQIIKDAQEKRCHYYDLGGVNPEDQNHPAYKKSWQGISRFKAGFGGEIRCYPQSFDLIYRPIWYSLYRLLNKARRLI